MHLCGSPSAPKVDRGPLMSFCIHIHQQSRLRGGSFVSPRAITLSDWLPGADSRPAHGVTLLPFPLPSRRPLGATHERVGPRSGASQPIRTER